MQTKPNRWFIGFKICLTQVLLLWAHLRGFIPFLAWRTGIKTGSSDPEHRQHLRLELSSFHGTVYHTITIGYSYMEVKQMGTLIPKYTFGSARSMWFYFLAVILTDSFLSEWITRWSFEGEALYCLMYQIHGLSEHNSEDCSQETPSTQTLTDRIG